MAVSMCVVKQNEQRAALAAFEHQPLFVGVESGDLIYLFDDGLYAFVASPEAVVVTHGAEPELGPHAFASATRVIRVEGIHARRLRDAVPLAQYVRATRDGDVDPERVLAEWMDFCDEVVHTVEDDEDGHDGTYLEALVVAKAKVWAVTDAEALTHTHLAAAKEELVVVAQEAAARVDDIATLHRTRAMILGMTDPRLRVAVA